MKGMSKGVGPYELGTPKGVGKMMEKSPMEIGMYKSAAPTKNIKTAGGRYIGPKKY